MDYTSIGGISGIVALVAVIVKGIYEAINHKRCRSNCCGLRSIVSLDIETNTPPLEKPLIPNLKILGI